MHIFTHNIKLKTNNKKKLTKNLTLPLIGPSAASLANPVKSLPE